VLAGLREQHPLDEELARTVSPAKSSPEAAKKVAEEEASAAAVPERS
jgi:hypothetical protein